MRPRPARKARISITPSVAARLRTETAIAENDSSAPVIQRTTRTMFLGATRQAVGRQRLGWIRAAPDLLRVGLVFRSRLFERRKLRAGCIDGDDLGKAIERHLQAARVVDLRHQANIGE